MITKIALLGSSRIHLGAVALVNVALNVCRKALAVRGHVLARESERLRTELAEAYADHHIGTKRAGVVRDAALAVAKRDLETEKKAAKAKYDADMAAACDAFEAAYVKAGENCGQRIADAVQDHSYAVEQYDRHLADRRDVLHTKLDKNSKGLQEVLDIAGQVGVAVQ